MICRLAAALMLSATVLSNPAWPAPEDPPGFVPMLRDGDLTGWVVEGRKDYAEAGQTKPIWTVQDGRIVCQGKGFGFLRYTESLGDFVIRLEYKMSRGCNSGLGIRGKEFTGSGDSHPSRAGYEMQILDDSGRAPSPNSSGSLYRYLAPATNASRLAGEWNQVEIECRGPKIRNKPLTGYFSLQNHGRHIEFRDLQLRKL